MARVLVVDDSKVMRINVGNMLKKLGHKVVAEADNGYAAIEMYKTHLPDFVTMDITMPPVNGVYDGIDAVGTIKKSFPEAKVIMVTSHGDKDKIIRAIKNGASNYILKPIAIEKLEEVIKKIAILN
jgi:two-component system chemotaxis response regulator CheY